MRISDWSSDVCSSDLLGELDQEGRLQSELAELRSKATSDIEAAKAQAIADLRGEVASLAIGAAEVVVWKNREQATQVQLIEDYSNQMANQRNTTDDRPDNTRACSRGAGRQGGRGRGGSGQSG